MQKIYSVIGSIVFTGFSSIASAALLDFNDPENLGVILNTKDGKIGKTVVWRDDGGGEGHLYLEEALDDDYIFLYSSSTYVNSFEMNALPWLGFTNDNMVVGSINIAGSNAADDIIWSTTVDLTSYTDWNNWFTVSVETADITQLTFFAPGALPYENTFWPSIDNMVINQPVPVPAAAWLFVSGLAGFYGLGLRRHKNK